MALAGCGSSGATGSSSTSSSATGRSAVAGFLAMASASCVNTDKQLGALATPGVATPSGDHATLVKLVAAEIPIDEAELRKLATVRAPAGQRRASRSRPAMPATMLRCYRKSWWRSAAPTTRHWPQ
jgi:L-aminopeptidase/D-esterase-like protein